MKRGKGMNKKIWAKDLSIEPLDKQQDDPFAMHVEYSLFDLANEEWEMIHYEEGDLEGAPEGFDCLYIDCDETDVFLAKEDYSEITGCAIFPMRMFLKENDEIYADCQIQDEGDILATLAHWNVQRYTV